jgi:hypothetical protein
MSPQRPSLLPNPSQNGYLLSHAIQMGSDTGPDNEDAGGMALGLGARRRGWN